MALRVEPGVVPESRQADFLELVSKELSHGTASELARRAVAEAVEAAYEEVMVPEWCAQPAGSGQKRGVAASDGSESPSPAFGAVPPGGRPVRRRIRRLERRLPAVAAVPRREAAV